MEGPRHHRSSALGQADKEDKGIHCGINLVETSVPPQPAQHHTDSMAKAPRGERSTIVHQERAGK